jgi:hypothetical protein
VIDVRPFGKALAGTAVAGSTSHWKDKFCRSISDFTNTLVVGGKPNADQQRLYDLCMAAQAPGEKELHSEASCLTVYRAVHNVFDKAGVGDAFPHHAGTGSASPIRRTRTSSGTRTRTC